MHLKPLILVAEDDPDDQYFFQEAVEVIGCSDVETYFILDGSRLLTLLRNMRQLTPRKILVVLDLNMQVRDGQSTLNEIKADPALADIPVAILTTSSNEADMEYCLRHGAAAYYRKPDSITALVRIVETLCRDYLQS